MATQDKDLTSEESLRLLTLAVWNASDDNDGDCPPEKVPVFRQLDDLISTTAWGEDARSEFFRRWMTVEKATDKTFDGVGSIAQLAHLTWQEAVKSEKDLKHPLAPLIDAWHTGPLEVEASQRHQRYTSEAIRLRHAYRNAGEWRKDRQALSVAVAHRA